MQTGGDPAKMNGGEKRGGGWWMAGWIAVIGVIGLVTFGRAVWSKTPRTDFTVYQLAGAAILNGEDIYRVQNVRQWNYVYPPVFAIVMTPFARLSVPAGVVLFYAISVACVAGAYRLCGKLTVEWGICREDGNIGGKANLFALALIAAPGIGALTRGQASVEMLWLLMAGIWFESRGRNVAGAFCLAGAILLKVFPILILCYYAWERRWKLIALTVAALLTVGVLFPAVVLGWRQTFQYWGEWERLVGAPAMNLAGGRGESPVFGQLLDPERLRNQSLEAVFNRNVSHRWGDFLAFSVGGVAAIAMLARFRKGQKREGLIALSAAVCWLLLVSPVAEGHYFVILELPLAVLAAHAIGGGAAARRWCGGGLAVFAAGELLDLASDAARYRGALCWGAAAIFVCLLGLRTDIEGDAIQ